MKLNPILGIVALGISSLLSYLVSSLTCQPVYKLHTAIASGVCFGLTLIPALALTYESSRLGTNLRLLSGVFLVLFLISHFCFSTIGVTMHTYIITNGILLLVFLAIFYKMKGIKTV